jgi:hypothetical protein
VPRLRRDRARVAEDRDVLEQDLEVDLLLVVGPERHLVLLADQGEDGHVVELGVVEAVEEVDRARAGRGDADADLAGELRVPAGHEGGHLLVPDLRELGIVVCPFERAEEAVDPVTGVAVDAVDSPLAQALENEVGDELGHGSPPRIGRVGGSGRQAGTGNALPA